MLIKDFTDLKSWQACRLLTKRVYQASQNFPASEQFGLTSQMRRAAVSSAANIAEGFGRRTSKDQEHFYVQAFGSLVEVKSHILIADDVGLVDEATLTELLDLQSASAMLLQGLLRSHRNIRTSKIKNRESNG